MWHHLQEGLALPLALRWLRRHRMAWLACAAVALTVTVPVTVLGVMQGWIDITSRQLRGAEADLTIGDASDLLPEDNPLPRHLARIEGVAGVAPFIKGEAVITPASGGDRIRTAIGARIEGIDWSAEEACRRLPENALHARPVLDLRSPPLTPEERGSGFLTRTARAHLALAGLEALAGLTGMALPPPARAKPFKPGVVLGRELIYYHGQTHGPLAPGRRLTLALPDGQGGLVGQVEAEVSDTLGTGVYEIDRFTAFLALPSAQRLRYLEGRHPSSQGRTEINGYRLVLNQPEQAAQVQRDIQAAYGIRALHWMDLRGHLVKNLEVQRNILAFVMSLVQLLCVFLIYTVFSTLVVERRHDLGVLLGLGARRQGLVGAVMLAGLIACLLGGVVGWALGWGLLAGGIPLLERCGIPLFPQEVCYTPEAPISFDPRLPLACLAIMGLVGLAAAALPAWRAGRIDPIETLRENG